MLFVIQIPSPGAVCPAIVKLPFFIIKEEVRTIRPDTRNTIVLAPFARIAALKLPGPLSFKLVTSITFPPRPPVTSLPKPSAPGKAYAVSVTGSGPVDGTAGELVTFFLQAANNQTITIKKTLAKFLFIRPFLINVPKMTT